MNERTQPCEILRSLDRLWQWANDVKNLDDEIKNRPFNEFVAWKIPFSMDHIDEPQKNIGVRVFCVQSLLQKLSHIINCVLNSSNEYTFCRPYSIITEPNMFFSEVGIIFSEVKWNQMLIRDVNTDNFREKTKPSSCLLEEHFLFSLPERYSCASFSHIVEDKLDAVYFEGFLHAIWQDLNERSD